MKPPRFFVDESNGQIRVRDRLNFDGADQYETIARCYVLRDATTICNLMNKFYAEKDYR